MMNFYRIKDTYDELKEAERILAKYEMADNMNYEIAEIKEKISDLTEIIDCMWEEHEYLCELECNWI